MQLRLKQPVHGGGGGDGGGGGGQTNRLTEPDGGGSSGRSRNDAGREPPAQGERALQADLGKCVTLGKQWGGFSRYTGLSPLTSVRRAPSHHRQEPRLRTSSQVKCTPSSVPCGSHFTPRAPGHGLPPVSTLWRPWFRTRPRSPSFQTAGFHPPQVKGGQARPLAEERATQAGVAAWGVGCVNAAGRSGWLPWKEQVVRMRHSSFIAQARLSLHRPSLSLPL